MRNYSQSWVAFLISGSLVSLVGCASQPNLVERDRLASPSPTATISPTSPTSPAGSTPQAQNSPSPTQVFAQPTRQPTTAATTSTTMVTIYQIDNQCANLVSEQVAVPSAEPMEEAVKKVLAPWDTADFSLAGYRVTVDPASRVATVDLRVDPNSKRQLTSLSSCEQLALFGSLQKTLTANRQWNVESVRFTEKGKELVF